MRQSIGTTWLFGLVIVFILLFTSYLAVTVNYTKSFSAKNAVIDILEQEEGLTPRARNRINDYLADYGYAETGYCHDNWMGNGETRVYKDNKNEKFSYCIMKHNAYSDGSDDPSRSYYSIMLFFKLDLPIFGPFMTFRVTGETTEIYYPADYATWSSYY